MKYEIKYSDESIEDLLKIYDYIANHRNEQANALALINIIRNEIKKLDELPHRHPVVSFSPWQEIGIRYLVVKNHIVFYFANQKKFVVNIVRIFSSRQSIANIINNGDIGDNKRKEN